MSRGSGCDRAGLGACLARIGWSTGERAVALALLLTSAPVVTLIALYIRLVAGGPVLYRGTRLGRDMRPFTMFKLRTLRVGASQITGGDLLAHHHQLTIPGGSFLRETRLDELPQLWNIVRGEMSFVGPRPERPEVFETKCSGIPGYERRFAVRPGLIGISQLFTPHGTAKRYRTLIDNGVMRRESRGLRRLGIVAFTVTVVVFQVGRRAVRQLACALARLNGHYREKRRLRRVAPQGAVVHLARAGSPRTRSSRVIDMNEEMILVECEYEPGLDESAFVLDIPVPGRSQPAHRTARCTGEVTARRNGASPPRLLIRYKPCSPCSEYMIHQYFLRNSLAVPRRSWSGPPPAAVPPLSFSTSSTASRSQPAAQPVQAQPLSTPVPPERLRRVSLG